MGISIRQESRQRSMRVSAILLACVAFLALQASAEKLKAETEAQPTDSKFFSPGMMYPGMGHGVGAGYGMGMWPGVGAGFGGLGGYGYGGYGMGGGMYGGIWQYAPYLFAGYFDPYLFNAIFTPNMMYGNTMQALTGGKNLELDATMGASA